MYLHVMRTSLRAARCWMNKKTAVADDRAAKSQENMTLKLTRPSSLRC